MLTLAIPNRNGGRYLQDTLASLDRNRPHVRWWLQDGVSDDASLAIAERQRGADDVVASAPDRGQADALNHAFAQMGGDIIGFINADDLLLPGAAKEVMDVFARHPDVDLVYGETEFIDATGNVTGTHAGRIDSLGEILDIYRVWWNRRQWVQPEVFFRRTLWERVGQFDTSYHLAFDFDFWVRCFLAGARVRRLRRPLAQFRLHPAQKSRAAEAAAAEIRRCVGTHVDNARVPASVGRRVRAELDYDQFRLGEGRYEHRRPGFARYLIGHPQALRSAHVRRRLIASFVSRMPGSGS